MNLEESYEKGVKCNNEICDMRGDLPICYSESKINNFEFCDKYEYWMSFKERHDRLNQ